LPKDAHDLGYDSDGEIGPFYDTVVKEQPFEEYDEDPVRVEETVPPPLAGNDAPNLPNPPQLSENAIKGMKVAELWDVLRKRHQMVIDTEEVLVVVPQAEQTQCEIPPRQMVFGTVTREKEIFFSLQCGNNGAVDDVRQPEGYFGPGRLSCVQGL
jgi:hypothetical protein